MRRSLAAPRSLRAQLVLATTLTVLLAVGVTAVVGAALLRAEVKRRALDDLAHQAELLAGRERTALLPLAHLKDLRPFLRQQDERVEAPSLAAPSTFLPEDAWRTLRTRNDARGTLRADGREYDFAAERVGSRAFVLLRPSELATAGWTRLLEALLVAAAVGTALAVLTALGLARVIARPVRRVAEATRRLAQGAPPQPLPLEGPGELVALAASFNDLGDQLARAREAERSFLLSVSHELKTPLTAIRAWAEALRDGAVAPEEAAETVVAEAARLERLVADLLDLARMNRSEFSVERADVDLEAIVREVARRYAHHADGFGVEIDASAAPGARATGDFDRVLQIVSNLVENALRLTPRGGSVRVRATDGAIAVEDTGPGLARDDVEHAFERFYLHSRYGRERQVGTGLGLAIVHELATAMGGTVSVQSEPGRTTTFTLGLPVRRTAPAASAPSA